MYVKHPTADGDGAVNIIMPDGSSKELKMVEGIIDWPESVPLHSSFKLAPEPKALRELKRKPESVTRFLVTLREKPNLGICGI
jgi:hypothetical protein